ncbi:MAG: AAA family ATPase [Deltaproteobacteria bacterium]|nr:AAA family ATPase [Deltaproteobacteria bacterium]
MITELTARDFKGLNFTQPVTKKTIFLGKNGVGKSARTQALTLALLGYIPGNGKTNDEILSSFGSSDVVVVGFTLDGTKFERAWGRTANGSVKEAFKVDGTKISKETFVSTLGAKGNPKIFDLSLFLELSSQKCINYIMSLYPCGEDLSGLDTMIETQKKNINTMEDKARTTEKAAAVLTANRAAMQLPAGSLAETIAEIEKTEKEIETAQADLNEAKLQKAKEDQKKEITAAVTEKVTKEVTEKVSKQFVDEAASIPKEVFDRPPLPAGGASVIHTTGVFPELELKPGKVIFTPPPENVSSKLFLYNILTAMDAAGCEVCAARMIIKKELRGMR